MTARFGAPCPHGHPPGTCSTCRAAGLRGSEVDKDVGIAQQHRERLKARVAGNVAAGLLVDWQQERHATDVADDACLIAEAILQRCGL